LWHERRTRFSALDVALEGRADSLIGAVRDAEDLADTIKVNPAEFSPSSTDVYAVYSQEANWWGFIEPANYGHLASPNGFRNIHGKSHTYPVFQRQAVRIIEREESGGDGLRRPIRLCEITIT
jgi:hypothetical protein